MPDNSEQRRALIQQLHAAPLQLVLQITGGGSLAISDLLTIPGGSKILLAADVPYCEKALAQLLGKAPEQACSERTARLMAMAAWLQARQFATYADAVTIGLGCTASLASDRPKRGEHRIHLALQTRELTRNWSLTLDKDRRSREEEERLTADAILCFLRSLLQASSSTNDIDLELELTTQEKPLEQLTHALEAWQPLMNFEPYVVAATGVRNAGDELSGQTIFSGSFAPLHEGHRQIAAFAEQRFGQPVRFEISAWNVDKPPLDYWELQQRVNQFDTPANVWLTNQAKFIDKARLFPGATFLVGVDTVKRIANPRYYHGDTKLCALTTQALAAAGCRFLVYGRINGAGVFETLADCELPSELRAICEEIPEAKFRRDVSSTDLRRNVDGVM
jgi:nicotinamide mononucleotide (NMN) deamidase PncC